MPTHVVWQAWTPAEVDRAVAPSRWMLDGEPRS